MNKPVYPVRFSKTKKTYTFTSVGENGVIQKIVAFTEFQANVYNLGFGDFDKTTQEVDDEVVTNNGDMEKVLATVFFIIQQFFIEKPAAWVYIEGSTPSRTRLYQVIINKFYDEFQRSYEIHGIQNDVVSPFEKNVSYDSFLIKKML